MKILKAGVGVILALLSVGVVRTIKDRYKVGIYYISREEERAWLEEEMESMDLRGTPTHECICGSRTWNLIATFDNYEISTYLLDMMCVDCGSIATAPTPMDRENME